MVSTTPELESSAPVTIEPNSARRDIGACGDRADRRDGVAR
jgi:hypothetical protein